MLLHIFNCFDWFIYRRKLFQKSFENVFEVLEKEKEIPSSLLLAQPRPSSLLAEGRDCGPAQVLMS
jgi:hypothetical protein